MTLALVSWCKNGVVLCADSRSSFPDAKADVFRQASDTTEKLFRLGRVGAVTSGYGEFLGRTIYSHIQDISDRYEDEPPSIVARDLSAHFRELYTEHISKYPQQRQTANNAVIDFLVGGYEDDEPACYRATVAEQDEGSKIEIKTARGPAIIENGMGIWRMDGEHNFCWIGDADVVESLVLGYHSSRIGNHPEYASSARFVAVGYLGLQDCVDLLYFLTEATERMKHFSSGDGSKFGVNRTVGGPIDVAVVRRKTGFESVKRKELQVNPQLSNAPRVREGDA
jgi:20S proteasome alpha/beta subunit